MRSLFFALIISFFLPPGAFGADRLVVAKGEIVNPKGISNFSKNDLIVLDGQTGEVLLVNKDNTGQIRFLFRVTRGRPTALQAGGFRIQGKGSLSRSGNSPGFAGPEALPPSPIRKRIFIGNATLGTVDVYNGRGRYLRSFRDGVGYASDMVFGNEHLYVVDSEYRDIKVFRNPGRLVDTIEHSMLARPCNIAINQDVIYISDNGDSKAGVAAGVVMFDGHTHEYLGRLAGDAYGFARPRGLAFDGSILQISETLLGKIIRIDLSTMERIEDLGEFGNLKGQLISPKDIYFDKEKRELYVVNHRNRRIEALEVP